MRKARSLPLVLAFGVVLVAGCLPNVTSDLPATFTREMQEERGVTFEAASQPSAGAMRATDLVAHLAAVNHPTGMLRTRAVPVFGVVRCIATQACQPGLYGVDMAGGPQPVWLVVYPDHVGRDGDVGWVVVRADGNFSHFGFTDHDPLRGQ